MHCSECEPIHRLNFHLKSKHYIRALFLQKFLLGHLGIASWLARYQQVPRSAFPRQNLGFFVDRSANYYWYHPGLITRIYVGLHYPMWFVHYCYWLLHPVLREHWREFIMVITWISLTEILPSILVTVGLIMPPVWLVMGGCLVCMELMSMVLYV